MCVAGRSWPWRTRHRTPEPRQLPRPWRGSPQHFGGVTAPRERSRPRPPKDRPPLWGGADGSAPTASRGAAARCVCVRGRARPCATRDPMSQGTAGPTADARLAGPESGRRARPESAVQGAVQVAAPRPPPSRRQASGPVSAAGRLAPSGTRPLAHAERAPCSVTLPAPGSATRPHEEGAGRMGGAACPPHEPLPKASARTLRRPPLRPRGRRTSPSL